MGLGIPSHFGSRIHANSFYLTLFEFKWFSVHSKQTRLASATLLPHSIGSQSQLLSATFQFLYYRLQGGLAEPILHVRRGSSWFLTIHSVSRAMSLPNGFMQKSTHPYITNVTRDKSRGHGGIGLNNLVSDKFRCQNRNAWNLLIFKKFTLP